METHGDTLAEELITEILLRLPVKSLLRFRCVSKSWLSLIASPRFVKSHLLLSATNKDYTHHRVVLSDRSHDLKNCYLFDLKNCSLSSLLCGAVIESFDLDYPGKYAYDRPYIVGSFNGLICLSIWGAELYLFLCNPSLKKYKKLPDGGFNCDAAPKFGFAYDDSRDDYKVVCFFHVSSPGGTYGTEVEIYSLKSDSWRRVDGFQGSIPLGAPGKLVNGKLHWYSDQNVISLDLADEKWAEVVMPHFKQCFSLELGVFGSDLSAMCNYAEGMCNYAEGRKVVADVWVMKEYGVKESWTKMFTIKSPNDFTRHISPPIFMSNEGEILLQCGSCLVKYNPKDDSIKSLNVTNSALHGKAQIYVKSLVCPF